MQFDILIKNGRYFDGSGTPSRITDVGIRDGKIAAVGNDLAGDNAKQIINASGKWVTPGFIDSHTHYDAELLVAPSLSESVRHGVTTVLVGSCSLSMVCASAEDCADIFTRVEAVPREQVLPILRQLKTWSSPKEWVEFLRQHPLGPNVISFLGHSDLRCAAMGLHKATDRHYSPTEAEQRHMQQLLQEALEVGFLGLSSMSLKWDKVDGEREWSKSLPSTYAKQPEIRALNKLLRRYNRVHQGAPDAANPLRIRHLLGQCIGWLRKPLKTTLITMMDLKGNKTVRPMAVLAASVLRWLGADLRWQILPTPFKVYADGIDIVIFEEFGAGEMALDLRDQVERNALLKDESYRREFRRFYKEKLSPRVWQRDFGDAIVLDCPEPALIGRNFSEIATERGIDVVDLFLDLVVAFGKKLRWYTVIGNHRPDTLAKMVNFKQGLITFSDAGAHIRNMAFYNLPLRLLKLAQQQQNMPPEKAIWRLTGEQADWFGIDAGHIREGDRADVVILDPSQLHQELEEPSWAEMQNFGGLQRLVNRNPGIINSVIINGKLAFDGEKFAEDFGQQGGYGQFLAAK